MKTLNSLIIVFLLINLSYSQNITRYNGQSKSIDQLFESAHSVANKQQIKSYNIIYSFKKQMQQNHIYGNFYSDHRNDKVLAEILYPEMPINILKTYRNHFKNALDKIVTKEVAVIFEYKNNKIFDISMCTLDTPFDLEDRPTYFISNQKAAESMQFISRFYKKDINNDFKESLIGIAGMHGNLEESYNFLKDIIENERSNDLREDAVFWIGETEYTDVVPYLKKLALSDVSEDVAEKAIFSLHNIETEESLDAIIEITHEVHNSEVKEKAVFWLGQLAGEKAIETLSDIVYSDEKTEIQAQAVFALSQIDENKGIPKLIKIANSHPNPEVRKKAIFWLGESGDDRAIEALIQMVKN